MATTYPHKTPVQDAPTRAAIVKSARVADDIVADLLRAGIPDDRITVVSDAAEIRRRFNYVNAQSPAGRHTVQAIIAGAALGLLLGLGGAALIGLTGSEDQPRLQLAMIFPFAAALVGGFIGAMLTRGSETGPANFSDQEAAPDRIVVAVELAPTDTADWLRVTEEVMRRHGAESLPLERG